MADGAPLRIWRGAVLDEWIDYNGHMSEGFYGVVFGMASDEYLTRMGFDERYRTTTGGSFYTVETHIVFVDEVAPDAALAVDTTVAGADPKRVHLFHELRRVGDEALAATQESMMLHVDTNIDRVAPMGADLYAVLRADARAHSNLLPEGTTGRAIRRRPNMTGMARLQVIGGGKMGEALLVGLVASSLAEPADLHVTEPDPARQEAVAAAVPGVSVSSEPVGGTDAVIAVKPDVVADVLPALASAGVNRVLSIAAGIRTDAIEAGLPAGTPVVRAMPNTPALVGKGAAAIAPGSAASSEDLDWARGILEAVGTVAVVSEADLDAVTGLSGSGPAYLFRLAEALRAAGTAQGLDSATADALTRQTLLGAATLLAESGEDPGRLRENVTSPGGTTAAGIAVLDDADFMGLIDRVVDAATKRSRELGQ